MLWALEGHTKPSANEAEDDPFRDPLLRDLKRIIPYHPMWNDPDALAKFAEGLHRESLPQVSGLSTHSVESGKMEAAPPLGKDHEFLAGEEGARRWMRTKRL